MAISQDYNWPSSSEVNITGIGSPTGNPTPADAVYIAGKNPEGNLTGVAVTDGGAVIVTPDPASTGNVNLTEVGGAAVSLGIKTAAASIPVTLPSDGTLPLPTGAATSALQTSGNTTLASILLDQTNGTQITQISQTTPGTTNGVVVNSSALPTGASTSSLQTAGNSSLSTIASNTTDLIETETAPGTPASFAITVQGNASGVPIPVSLAASTGTSSVNIAQYGGSSTTLGIKAAAASIPVVIASDQVVPISATTLPLPTGAATSANQTNGTQKSQAATPTPLSIHNLALTVGITPVRLTITGSAPDPFRVVLVVGPDPATLSTVSFYIGDSTVTNSGATRGIPITVGQTFIANNDSGDYYIVASAAGQTVEILEQY